MGDSLSDLFWEIFAIITIVLFVCLVVFMIFDSVFSFWFPCSFDHFFARGIILNRDFCVVCGLDLRPPRCVCGAPAKSSGYCPDCGFCFDLPDPLVTEVTGDE